MQTGKPQTTKREKIWLERRGGDWVIIFRDSGCCPASVSEIYEEAMDCLSLPL